MNSSIRTMERIEKNAIEETHLFSNFERHYSERDFVKASEFLWGSVSKIAYSIGLLHGLKLGRHGELVAFIRNLAKSKNEPSVFDWIDAAESLHSNFYHNWMEPETFEEYCKKALNLRNWLTKTLYEEYEKFKRERL